MFCRDPPLMPRRADTKPSLAALCTPAVPSSPAVRPTVAIRPIEASKAAVCYVRSTSKVDQMRKSRLRKKWTSADKL
jgi:hypothetical protein